MAQLITVRLNKGAEPSWGFRLQGGKDFGTPLVVQKVNVGSPAERAGLIAGDSVIKINNTDVYNLRHKDAQDVIVRAGPSFELIVQRGGSTWKPSVTPTSTLTRPQPSVNNVAPVTKTSLAASRQENIGAIGTGHNVSAKPFSAQVNGAVNGGGPKLVNKQYNSPLGLYSEESIAETLSAQAEVLSPGVLGVNFKKNEKNFDASTSAVLRMVQEAEKEPREPEPVPRSENYHPALGRQVTPRSLTPQSDRSGRYDPQRPAGNCADQDVTKCSDCERVIVGVFVRIKDKNLHVECFKCATCGTSLKNVGYYNINNKLYCDIHAKLAARSNPPAPNLAPVTVPPGGRAPVNAISSALNSHPLPSGPLSPSSNVSAAPFQQGSLASAPDEDNVIKLLNDVALAAKKKSETNNNARAETVLTNSNGTNDASFCGVRKFLYSPNNITPLPFNKYIKKVGGNFSGPRPFSSVSGPLSPSLNSPTTFPKSGPLSPKISAPAPSFNGPSAYSATSAGRSVQNKVWPPPPSEPELPTASPLYFPPPPKVHVAQKDFSSTEESRYEEESWACSEEYTEMEQIMQQAPKMSICSAEVSNITDRRSAVECIGTISGTLDTQILVESILQKRPPSPPPIESDIVVNVTVKSPPSVLNNSKTILSQQYSAQNNITEVSSNVNSSEYTSTVVRTEQNASQQKNKITERRDSCELKRPTQYKPNTVECKLKKPGLENSVPKEWVSPMLTALTIDPEKTNGTDTFSQIPTKRPMSALAAALAVAPSRPFTPLPPTSNEPIPLPEETEPYFPPEHPIIPAEPEKTKEKQEKKPPKPDSPFLKALQIAPERPYTPVNPPPPPRKKKQKEDPLLKDLPKPERHLTMREALATASDKPYPPFISDITVEFGKTITYKKDQEQQKQEEEKQHLQKPLKPAALPPSFKQPILTAPKPFPCNFPPISDELRSLSGSTFSLQSEVSSEFVEQSYSSQKTSYVSGEIQEQGTKVEQTNTSQETANECATCTCKKSAVTEKSSAKETFVKEVIEKQKEDTVFKKPLALAAALRPVGALPQYQVNLSENVEMELLMMEKAQAAQKFAESTVQQQTVIKPTPVSNAAQQPHPHQQQQKTAPVITIQPGEIQPAHVFHPVVEDRPSSSLSVSSRPRPVTPSMINKPAPSIPYYQANLVAQQYSAPESNLFDPKTPEISRSPSPCPPEMRCSSPFRSKSPARAKSPAPGPPPNPMKSREPLPNPQSTRRDEAKRNLSTFIPQYKEKRDLIEKAQINSMQQYQGGLLQVQSQNTLPVVENSYQVEEEVRKIPGGEQKLMKMQNFGSESSACQREFVQGGKQTKVSAKSDMQHMEQLNKSESHSVQKSDDGLIQVERKRTVTEEFEQTHKSQVIQIQSSTANGVQKHPFRNVNIAELDVSLGQGIVGLHVTNPQPIRSTFLAAEKQIPPLPTTQFKPNQPPKQPVPPPVSALPQPVQSAPKPAAPHAARATSSIPVPKPCSISNAPKAYSSIPSAPAKPSSVPFAPKACATQNATPSSSQCVSRPNVPPPHSGVGGGRQAGAIGVAPKRGRGVLNAALGGGTRIPLCGQCHMQIRGPFITALGKIWCPEHFTCSTPSCRRPLQDLGFVEERGQLYCEYCFEQYLAPPCSKCGSKVKGDCLKAIGKNFHPECFNCSYCGKLFGNSPFFLEDGQPYCENDWNELFTTKCFACGFPVEAGDRWVEALNNNYHSQCFNCTMCKKNLEGQSFFAKGGRPFCKNHAR